MDEALENLAQCVGPSLLHHTAPSMAQTNFFFFLEEAKKVVNIFFLPSSSKGQATTDWAWSQKCPGRLRTQENNTNIPLDLFI